MPYASHRFYMKPHQRDVMKLRLNTGFEGTHTFVILRYPKIHLSVEARHWKKGACSGFH